jgi:hypothetical protein
VKRGPKRSARLTAAKVRRTVTTSALSGKVAEGRDVYRRVPTYRLAQLLPQMAAARAKTAQDLPGKVRGAVQRERQPDQ